MRYKSLDGLRGIAAMTVVISHFCNQTGFLGGVLGWGGGQIGVMLFFCLSGFLMGRLYLDTKPDPVVVAQFFRRRVARVFPLYLILVAMSYGWGRLAHAAWPLYAVNDRNLLDHLLFWRGTDVLWSVPVEVQFYIAFPVFWLVYSRSRPAFFLLMATALAAVVSFHFPSVPALLQYLPMFLVGILSSLVPDRALTRSNILFLGLLGLYVVSLPGVLAALGLSPGALYPASQVKAPWFSPAYFLLIPALLLASICSPLAQATLGSRPAVHLGIVSYSIYLLHYPIMRSMSAIEPLKDHPWLLLPLFLTLMLVLSTLCYRLIERPLRRMIIGRSQPTTAPSGQRQLEPSDTARRLFEAPFET